MKSVSPADAAPFAASATHTESEDKRDLDEDITTSPYSYS
jgi:hypothetical protein